MNTILRRVLAVLAGLVLGSVVNMGLIHLGMRIIAPPPGADVLTVEGLRAAIHLFEPKHFLFPFLAHALGTLTGALLASLLAGPQAKAPAVVVGLAFFAGGAANVMMLPGPMWFNLTDLLLAYAPMAWLGRRAALCWSNRPR